MLFEFDRAALSAGARRRLGDVARRIRAARPQEVAVEGHTDSKGSDAYNDRLSRRRAESVARGLRAALGAAAPTLATAGRGERDPVVRQPPRERVRQPARPARNRRVTVAFAH